jgi:hypothetical protein
MDGARFRQTLIPSCGDYDFREALRRYLLRQVHHQASLPEMLYIIRRASGEFELAKGFRSALRIPTVDSDGVVTVARMP